MFRRLSVLLLCLCLLLPVLSACGGGDPSAQTASSEQVSSADSRTEDSSVTSEKLTSEDVFAASEHLVGLCDQGNSRVIVCDLSVEDWSDDNAVVWEFEHENCKSVAGIKLRDSEYWGEPVLVLCYHGGAMIVSFNTKKVLLHTQWTGTNPHSVELLPDGCLVVASSTDNDVRIYAPGADRPSDTVEFPNAHGVLWDPKYEVLWIEGKNQLSAFAVKGTTENPELSIIGGMTYYTPKSGLHDLAPVYGDPDKLFVTCGAGIMIFDKVEEEFSYAYPGSVVGKKQTYAPGCGSFEDGVFVFTTIREDTMVLNDWCTNQVGIYVPLGNGRGKTIYRKAPDDAYYKVRVWNSDYQ